MSLHICIGSGMRFERHDFTLYGCPFGKYFFAKARHFAHDQSQSRSGVLNALRKVLGIRGQGFGKADLVYGRIQYLLSQFLLGA